MGKRHNSPSFAVEKSSSFHRSELSDSITGGVSLCRAIRSHRSANGPQAVFISMPTGNSQHSSSPLLPQFTQRDWRLWTIGKAPAPADGPLRLSRAPSAASKLGRSHADIPMVGLACCARPSFPFPHFLFEELFDVRHRPEQLHWLVGKRKKAFTLVEAARIFILSIYDHCEGRDLAPDGPKEGIRQQKPAPWWRRSIASRPRRVAGTTG